VDETALRHRRRAAPLPMLPIASSRDDFSRLLSRRTARRSADSRTGWIRLTGSGAGQSRRRRDAGRTDV